MAVLMTITTTLEDTSSLTAAEAHDMVDPIVQFIRQFANSQKDAGIVTALVVDYSGNDTMTIKIT